MYAIIDIETTGGKFNEEGMTEIAIHRFNGKKVVDQLITLVNPEKPIQPFVIQLTGINDKMLVNAPKFHEIAKQIIQITEDCVIVAHNANFDYRILRNEFRQLGYNYVRDTLCTVELSRKLIPHQDSYSLGKLCRSLGIPTSDRHRANGDAVATVKLFKLLLSKDIEKTIIKSNIKAEGKNKTKIANKGLNDKFVKLLDKCPRKTGVFYLHNKKGDILYIGKNRNIRNGFNQIILRTSKRAAKLHKQIHDLSFEETGSLLIANLKCYLEVTHHQPFFNFSKKNHLPTTVFHMQNALLIDVGRNPTEKSVFLLENGIVKGYAYIELTHQITNLHILKTILSPIADNLYTRHEIKKYIDGGKFKKIIRIESEEA